MTKAYQTTLGKNTTPKIRGVGPKIKRRNLLYSFGWIISPFVRSIPLSRRFFFKQNHLNTEAKYSSRLNLTLTSADIAWTIWTII